MTQRRGFDKNYLQQEFDKLNANTKHQLTLFLIGGGAMAFYGLKDATKDIDIILTSSEDLNGLKAALESTGYKTPEPAFITTPYNNMQTNAILENQDGFRWDLFVNKVCNALTLTAAMKQRAKQLYKGNCLTVAIAAKEDVFILKGITERETDLDDMRILAESGLQWNIINQECQNQSAASGRIWEDALYQKLLDLKAKHHIESPIEKLLRDSAEKKLVTITLLEEIKKGQNTIKGIAQAIKEPQGFVRKELERLATEGIVKVDKSQKPHKFKVNKAG
ncbi:MAG: hypothetical protein NWF00_09840 [Candidatus Bathyarchaeota archaeon]|nr:hypothetical protein [Candidatus Bathyarchaeota archaeon]